MFGMVRLSLVLSCTMFGCSGQSSNICSVVQFFQVKDLIYLIMMLFQFHLISLFDFSVYSNVIISELFPNKYFDEFYSYKPFLLPSTHSMCNHGYVRLIITIFSLPYVFINGQQGGGAGTKPQNKYWNSIQNIQTSYSSELERDEPYQT